MHNGPLGIVRKPLINVSAKVHIQSLKNVNIMLNNSRAKVIF